MPSVKTWSEVLGSSNGNAAAGDGRRMVVNLKNVVEKYEELTSHEKYVKCYESKGRFKVEYEDYKVSFEQKGWTIYHWSQYERREGRGRRKEFADGLTFRSDGVVETLKMLRAKADGVEYKRPKPTATELDPKQKIYEMEQFCKTLQSKLQGHPLFVSAYISHVYIFAIYHDILFAIRPDDYGNYEYELLERAGDLETKLCKTGKTVGQGGVMERIKELRSAWDLTHDLTPELIEEIKKGR